MDMADEMQTETEYTSRGFRAEWLLGGIALLSAALLIAVFVLSLPYMNKEDDPERLVHKNHVNEVTEPTDSEEDIKVLPPAAVPDRNPYGRFDFQYGSNNYLQCLRQDSYAGVDVSAYQKEIDWQAVRDSGIRFAMIRLGYRGYGEAGRLVEDEFALKNLEGAAQVGLPIGAYFFSQALNIQEAEEEIAFMLDILGDCSLQMPIILDWEIPADNARTADMDPRTLTDIQLRFCEVMTEKGYTPMVYFNRSQANELLYLTELEDYPFWLAMYKDRMTYPYQVEMWQYTDRGSVPGITGNVDVNVYIPKK